MQVSAGVPVPEATSPTKVGTSRAGGVASIGDLFTSLGTKPPVLGPRFAELKANIAPPPEKLAAAWERLQAAVEKEVAEIKALGSAAVPSVDFKDLDQDGGRLPPAVAEQVRRRGCLVVRNTLEPAVALAMKQETKDYLSNNADHIAGFPPDKPQVWEAYWSKPQGRMRQHPNVLKTQRALNRLWRCSPAEGTGQVAVDVHRPLTYGERLRIRLAGDKSFTLGPHVDGGSVERWEDEEYRKVYRDILSGDWERFDPYDATHRAEAKCDLYDLNVGACTIFRTFQGWCSLSNSGAGRGALLLNPMIKEATAYWMLRPFLEDVPADSFCGANPGKTQDLFAEFHSAIIEGMVPIPDVAPGDTVWWHADMVHAVEAAHGGSEDSSVYYVPAVPLCRKNAGYAQRQAMNFREGRTPPDFPANDYEAGLADRWLPEDLDEAGAQAMCLAPMPNEPVEGEPEADFKASQQLREHCQSLAKGSLL